MNVQFAEELTRVLPGDLPHRQLLISIASRHLGKIEEANEYMNLTRITSPAEAAIKHVYDCVAPWRAFAGASKILDAGTGAGFPGLPLSVLMPQTSFTLAESVAKKARFIDAVADEFELQNVSVIAERAETVALNQKHQLITARAVAPLSKLIDLFRLPLRNGARLLLYKGPDVEQEIAAITGPFVLRVLDRYHLPDGMGSRTLVEVTRQSR